ncbi:MAG TPA: hypothetical protein DDX29_01295 [Clostridiales bacterium]|nr:hypothetical protein [Clostridiales bacterium]
MSTDHVILFPSTVKMPIDQFISRFDKEFTIWNCGCGCNTFFWTVSHELVCTVCKTIQVF